MPPISSTWRATKDSPSPAPSVLSRPLLALTLLVLAVPAAPEMEAERLVREEGLSPAEAQRRARGAAQTPPTGKCCVPAPAIIEFNADFLRADAIVKRASPDRNEHLIGVNPFKVNSECFGHAVFETDLKVLLHQDVSSFVIKDAAAFTVACQSTSLILSVVF